MHTLVNEWRWSLTAGDYSPRTIRDHTGFADRFLLWLEGEEVALSDATRRHAEQWLTSLSSAVQRRKATFGLKRFCRWAVEEELASDFAGRLTTPKVQSPPQPVMVRTHE
jgi:Phage integrase, N-terminal SAM-like domain